MEYAICELRRCPVSEDDYLENDDLDDDELEYDDEEDEYAEQGEGDNFEAPRVPLPKSLVWGLLVLLGLAAVVLIVWGVAHSTLTYSTTTVGPDTRARLSRLRDELAAAGAPAAALRQVERAAQPGVYTDEAIEALLDADKALGALGDDASIAPLRQELRTILGELEGMRYGFNQPSGTSSVSSTPMPTLAISK